MEYEKVKASECKYNKPSGYCTHKGNWDYRSRGKRNKSLKCKRCNIEYCPLVGRDIADDIKVADIVKEMKK